MNEEFFTTMVKLICLVPLGIVLCTGLFWIGFMQMDYENKYVKGIRPVSENNADTWLSFIRWRRAKTWPWRKRFIYNKNIGVITNVPAYSNYKAKIIGVQGERYIRGWTRPGAWEVLYTYQFLDGPMRGMITEYFYTETDT